MRRAILLSGALALVSFGACVDGEVEDITDLERIQSGPSAPGEGGELPFDADSTVPTVLNGQQTLERPEIGGITIGNGFCTATLIRRDVVITAAHCVDFFSRTNPGNHGRFEITQTNGQKVAFTVDLIFSFNDQRSSANDIALGHLSQPVPPEVATPTTMSDRAATSGEQVSIFGYGCTSRGGGGGGVKRKFTFGFGTSRNLCPGDSGGPVVIGDGPVALINSAYIVGSGEDLFGEVYTNKSRLIQQIVAWGGSAEPEDNPNDDPEVEPEPDPDTPQISGVRVDNNTGAKLWLHCAGKTASESCSDWTLVSPGEEAFIKTPNAGIYLYNVNQGADVIFNLRKVYGVGGAVTIFPNAIDPTAPASEGIPDDPNAVFIRNSTGAKLFIHCNGKDATEDCTGWLPLKDGESALIKTPGRGLYLYNVGQGAAVEFNLQKAIASDKEVTIFSNAADPFSSP